MESNKEKLFYKCLEILNTRIEKHKAEMELIKESMENEAKSSGSEEGDGMRDYTNSYEKTLQHIEEANELKNQLKQLDIFQVNDVVKMGSLVVTSHAHFFLSVPLGKIDLEGKTYFAISKEAPVGKLLLGKKQGDAVTFNGNTFTVIAIQ
jgi:transcription elongation GreA/GreB family factor